jgi:DNA-binding PadR family transcriptional regulator
MNFTIPTALILQALEQGACHGFEIMDVAGLPSGTVYPALRRLEQEGMISSAWEDPAIAAREQRPPRRYYEINEFGAEYLADARKRFRFIGKRARARKPRTLHA